MAAPRSSSCTLLLLCVLPFLVTGDANSKLSALQEEFFKWEQQMWPHLGTRTGTKEYNDRLDDYSIEVFDEQLANVTNFLMDALKIDRSELSRHHQYSYDVFLDTLETFKAGYKWRNYGPLNPISFLEAFYLDPERLIDPMPFETEKDYENLISRLEAWPTQVGQIITRMNKSIELRTTHHNVSMIEVPEQIAAVISTPVENSVFYGPFKDKLDNLTLSMAESRESLRARARAAIEKIWKALDNLKTFVQNTYIPNTRLTYGVDGLPNGTEYYRACLRWHLSVDMSPEEIHQTGLQEVLRITQNMKKIMNKQNFSGTINEYYNMLRADLRFRLNTGEEVIATYDNIIHNRTYPKLPLLFKDIPDLPVVVRPMPFDGIGAFYTTGTEDGVLPGIVYVNTITPNETVTFETVSVSLHEAVPGHHLDAIYALTSEIPNFQKQWPYRDFSVPYEIPFYTEHDEGWALYAEYLGEELQVFHDDYEMMGRYGEEMLRACRLVLDTGLHAFGWSREKAIQYLSQRIQGSLKVAQVEIDRYLTWPGQACSYKIGELKIKELRHKAKSALGPKFDIRDFHIPFLTNGKLPLPVMERIIDDYIADTMKATGKAPSVHFWSGSNVGMCLMTSLMITFIRH